MEIIGSEYDILYDEAKKQNVVMNKVDEGWI